MPVSTKKGVKLETQYYNSTRIVVSCTIPTTTQIRTPPIKPEWLITFVAAVIAILAVIIILLLLIFIKLVKFNKRNGTRPSEQHGTHDQISG